MKSSSTFRRAPPDGSLPISRFKPQGLRRDVAFEAMSTNLILDLVRHNLVIALLSPAVMPESDDLRAIPVAGGPTRVQYLAWSSFNPAPAAQAFLNSLTAPTTA